MSMKDYTKFMKQKAEPVVKPEEIQNGVEEVDEGEPVMIGIVVDCHRLNVRSEPDADAEVLGTIDAGSEVAIEDFTHDEFYKVYTAAGAEGYCMKNFIRIK